MDLIEFRFAVTKEQHHKEKEEGDVVRRKTKKQGRSLLDIFAGAKFIVNRFNCVHSIEIL